MALEDIKRISIRGYLGARGIKPQRERGNRAMYLSPLREETTASFSVNYDENVWYDHGLGEGGSIIDLVARMENCSVGEAIRRLEAETFGGSASVMDASSYHGSNPATTQHLAPASSGIEIASVGELRHSALMEYLHERGIDTATARKYCNEVRYRIGGREYFAIGFRNDAGGWELRNRNFKGSSTPKNITTIRGGGNYGATTIERDSTTGVGADSSTTSVSVSGSDTVMVFEGFVDFLSYLSLKRNPSPTIDTAILNSVANLRRAIPFLESHRTIHAFLDNDEAGRKALADLREYLPGLEVVDQSPFYRNHKDLNDYWRDRIADKIKRQASTSDDPRIVQNLVTQDNAANKIKRPTTTRTTIPADRFRRLMSATPVRKKGRGA